MVPSPRREGEGGERRRDAVSVVLMRGPESNVKTPPGEQGGGGMEKKSPRESKDAEDNMSTVARGSRESCPYIRVLLV